MFLGLDKMPLDNPKLFSLGFIRPNSSLIRFFLKNYSYLYTRHFSNFILNNLGVVFPFKFSYKLPTSVNLYILRKKMYSFLKVNERKMHIFLIKKKLLINKFFTKLKSYGLRRRKIFFSNRIFFSFFKNSLEQTKYKFETLRNSNSFSTIDALFKKSNLFRYEGTSGIVSNPLIKKKRIKISRIKFKPGYQRIWRHYRLALAESIDFRYIYQKQLTHFLVKFYRKVSMNHFTFNENRIDKITIYSRLVPDHFTFNLFFNHQLIYFNTKPLTSNQLYVYKNDFIQLEITNWYYIFSR